MIASRYGSQWLCRPACPAVEMAGFGRNGSPKSGGPSASVFSLGPSVPGVGMAGLEPAGGPLPAVESATAVACSPSGPGGGLAGFAAASAARTYRETVSRCTPNCRAIRRNDHPRSHNASIAYTSAILSRFAIPHPLSGG